MDRSVVDAAKKYAKSSGRSLSSIVEDYLKLLVKQEQGAESFEISPLVHSLWGAVKPMPDAKGYKELLEEELAKKYLK